MVVLLRRWILWVVLAALAFGAALACARVVREPTPVAGASAGIVEPFAALAGMSVHAVSLGAWCLAPLLALIAALAVRGREPDPHTMTIAQPRVSRWFAVLGRAGPWIAWLTVVVILGIALRVHAAAWSLWDIDEPWAFPSVASLFDDSHDALVHPPLYRALALGWDALVGWTLRSPRWLLRLPSVVCGGLALSLVGWLALPRASPRAALALALASVATATVEVSALARPYGAATLAVALVVVLVLDADARRFTPFEAALCVLAAALASWLDLVAGLAVFLVLALRCAAELRAGRWRDAAALLACASIPALPLVPGALVAWRVGIDPASSPLPGVLPDLQPAAAMSLAARSSELFGALSHPLPALAALALLCALILVASHRRAYRHVAMLVLLCALPLALLPFVELRARNLAWLPLVAAAVLATMPSPLPKRVS
jgi:hypothetical protein